MSSQLKWEIDTTGEVPTVKLVGRLTEDANLGALLADLRGKPRLRIELSEIGGINSCGVREWVNFTRELCGTTELVLEKCSPAIVNQLNMIINFAGTAEITSVLAPYICDDCGFEKDILIPIEPGKQPVLPTDTCPECNAELIFDSVEEFYFRFIQS